MKSIEIGQLAAALANAQSKIKGAIKDSANPFFKSSYADLQAVWDACREPLTANGLSVIQTTVEKENGNIQLVTTLAHKSGEFIQGIMPVLMLKNEPQALGSALSYARRYALAAIVGVYQTDDDAEAAQARNANNLASPGVLETRAKQTSGGAPAAGRLPPIDSPAVGAPTDDPSQLAKRPFFAKLKESTWTKAQLAEYSKAAFGKSDAKLLGIAELMRLSQVAVEKKFEEALAEGAATEGGEYGNFR